MRNKYKVPTNIKKRNNWFETLSDSDKRIAICKDAIEQIKTNRYVSRAQYGYFHLGITTKRDPTYINNDLQCSIDSEGCTVCGMGAVFASRVRLGNNINLAMPGDIEIIEKLNDLFDEEQLRLIEVAFEGDDVADYFFNNYGNYYDFIEYDGYHSAVKFYDRHSDDSSKLIAILENIVDNNGVFIP